MNKKRLLGLILFACLILTGLFAGVNLLISHGSKAGVDQNQSYKVENNTTREEVSKEEVSKEEVSKEEVSKEEVSKEEVSKEDNKVHDSAAEKTAEDMEEVNQAKKDTTGEDSSGEVTEGTYSAEDIDANIVSNTEVNIVAEEPWLSANPSDAGIAFAEAAASKGAKEPINSLASTEDVLRTLASTAAAPQLIYNCEEVDYMSYVPDMVYDSQMEAALKISNPSIKIDATAAILLDAETKEVLFYKDPVLAIFPASTAKLLTTLVALEWCKLEEEVTLGEEIKMIASDSSKAGLLKGQILSVRNLLEGMLVPSGNDAAYAVAAYVGRKSLQDQSASKEEAIIEFIQLMNRKAKNLGVKNSCFKTPDGYDAIGQYTTAYDMGLIGIAAAQNEIILAISQKSSARNIFVSGEDITWNNTNRLINRNSGQYYSYAIGLKTGTSTMAGRCLIAAAQRDGKEVVCVIMDSTSAGRWDDAITLLKYGLD